MLKRTNVLVERRNLVTFSLLAAHTIFPSMALG